MGMFMSYKLASTDYELPEEFNSDLRTTNILPTTTGALALLHQQRTAPDATSAK